MQIISRVRSYLQDKLIKKSFFAFYLILIFFLPTQLGKHFFPLFSYVNGVRVDYLAPTIYFTDLIIFILFIGNCRQIVGYFKDKKIIFVLLLLFAGVIFANEQSLALYRFIRYIEFAIVFFLARIFFRKNKKLILSSFLFSGLFQLVLGILQMVQKHSLQGIFYFFGERRFDISTPGIAKATLNGIELLRPYGTFSHPNSLAGFFLLIYFFVLIDKAFKKYSLFKYFSLSVFSILVFISFSKVAIFTFLILNGVYYLFFIKTECLICKFSKTVVPLALSSLFLTATTDPLTINKRIELLKNSFNILKNHLLFGVGLGNYLIYQSKYPSKFHLFFNQPVHNIFLLFVTEAGPVISIIFLILFIRTVKISTFKEYWLLIAVVVFTGSFDHYWLTLEQNFLLLAIIYGSVSNAFLIDKFNLRS